MNPPDVPLWAAILGATLLLLGAIITFIGSLGLLRLKSFYDRVHAPTLGTTLGTGSVLLGSMLLFSVAQSRFVIHEILIAVFVTVTTPVSLTLLARAALYRDRSEGALPLEEEANTEARDAKLGASVTPDQASH